jgi:hypothetical protein
MGSAIGASVCQSGKLLCWRENSFFIRHASGAVAPRPAISCPKRIDVAGNEASNATKFELKYVSDILRRFPRCIDGEPSTPTGVSSRR